MAGTHAGAILAWEHRLHGVGKVLKGRKRGAKLPDGAPATTDSLQKGQTLLQIAQKHGVSVASLIKANHLTSPDQIKAGMNLVIPARLSKAEKAAAAQTKAFAAEAKRQQPKKAKGSKSTTKKKASQKLVTRKVA